MTDIDPRLTPLAASLPRNVPFIGPDQQERLRGRPYLARIGANELGFGPSPKALTAISAHAADVWKYGDETAFELREALCALYDVAGENIIIGEGIDGLLGLLTRLTITSGRVAVTSAGSYPTFNYHVAGHGGTIQAVPYKNDRVDIDGLAQRACASGARLVYLASPDNPMGYQTPASEIERLAASIPSDCLLVLDEAYIEFAPAGSAPALDPGDSRVIRMRTLSKAYGLAGLRVGYAIGPRALIESFNLVRNHFGVGRLAQAAATAAILDQDHLDRTIAKNNAGKQEIARIAAQNGLRALPSMANFVAVDCGKNAEFSARVLDGLEARDIFVRRPFMAPQNRCLRISTAPAEEMRRLGKALPEALADARSEARFKA